MAEKDKFGKFYDRQGKKISFEEWGSKRNDFKNYCIVCQTVLPDGTMVSTSWVGMNCRLHYGESPLIFETCVHTVDLKHGSPILPEDFDELVRECYATEEEAIAGHYVVVKKYFPKFKEPEHHISDVLREPSARKRRDVI